MNCKKYRACLLGIAAIALALTIFFIVKSVRDSRIPSEGTLVEHIEDVGDESELWA